MKIRQTILLAIILIGGCYFTSCDSDESCTGPAITPYFQIDSISAIYYNEYSEQISDSVTVLGVYSEYRFIHRPGLIIHDTYRFIQPYRSLIGFGRIFDRCVVEPAPADTTFSRYSELAIPMPYIPGIDTAIVIIEYEAEFYDAFYSKGECRILEYGFDTWIDTIYAVYVPR